MGKWNKKKNNQTNKTNIKNVNQWMCNFMRKQKFIDENRQAIKEIRSQCKRQIMHRIKLSISE